MSLNCPQCGAAQKKRSAISKLIQCRHCGAALFIESNQITIKDLESKIYEKRSILKQGHRFQWMDKIFQPLGFVQYEYVGGYLTEWWVQDDQHQAHWLIENDEDFFLTQDAECKQAKAIPPASLQPNKQLLLQGEHWLVTQKQVLQFYGIQGELPFIPDVTRFTYIYLAQTDASTLIFRFAGERFYCRRGMWLDPFQIKQTT